MSEQSPFVVQQLRRVNPTGQSTGIYELNKASVSPTRILGRDARGMPIEDTMPTVFWKPFLMLDGCINKVPLRTGSVPSMHADAVAYENETMQDLIMAGWIPAWLCPYSTAFYSLTQGPFATPQNGETDCGGSTADGGCSHLKAVGKIRRDAVRDAYNIDQKMFDSRRDEEYTRMRNEIVSGVGEAIAKHTVAPQQRAESAKQRLRDGKADE